MSTRYLLDTCVISEFVKPQPEPKVVRWLNVVDADDVYLSAVTIGEIQNGISARPPSNRRTELEIWLNETLPAQFEGRVLALDSDIFKTWGKMTADQKRKGTPQGIMDSLIAATALHHDMILVTRNVSDFKNEGLNIFNPWEADE